MSTQQGLTLVNAEMGRIIRCDYCGNFSDYRPDYWVIEHTKNCRHPCLGRDNPQNFSKAEKAVDEAFEKNAGFNVTR